MEPITIPLEVLGEEERDEDTIMQEQEVVVVIPVEEPERKAEATEAEPAVPTIQAAIKTTPPEATTDRVRSS